MKNFFIANMKNTQLQLYESAISTRVYNNEEHIYKLRKHIDICYSKWALINIFVLEANGNGD